MAICPYFDQDERFCDVGEDYISPYDVVAMSHFCSSRYRECEKFDLLARRYPEVLVQTDSRIKSLQQPAVLSPVSAAVSPRVSSSVNTVPLKIKFNNRWPLSHRLAHMISRRDPIQYHSANVAEVDSLTAELPTKERKSMQPQKIKNRGLQVVLAGTGINLALGILYTWSIFKSAIVDSIATGGPGAFTWDAASINDPYAVACLAFAGAMILAGKCQDKFGPQVTCAIGGLLVGAGFIWISQTTNYWAWVVGFGMLAGTGIGFGYSAATPPALKWFSPAKTGLIAGIVVSGFGLASVYIAPLARYLLAEVGLQQSMMYFGIAFAVVVTGLGMLVSNPPADFVADPQQKTVSKAVTAAVIDLKPSQLFTNGKFYTLWLCFFIGSGAGLMVIGSAKGLAKASMGEMAFLVVVIMSIGNAAGRLIAGVVSDKIGRATTLCIVLVFQACMMFAAIPILGSDGSSPILVALLVTAMVFNYGTNLSLFPSFAKDYWGMKNFGMNYGLLFSAWGIGAFVLVRVSEMLKVKTGSMESSFIVAGVLLLVGAMMSMSLRPKKVAVPAKESVFVEEEELVLQKVQD
ncbi:Nitrate/nitrite transporter NarK [Desulfuromusa kysingii]|uniref:Nitrate/nitrite transporter NarK n=2 Tax=Desulfuromusa kysingii TaxID=37625 RepID=A0A1H3XFG5_9BACT|nr:OFA family MFS transporter [Desulfuromusa kysingii]SDZ97352.1 Nitrate/nitrite transporter NarK [Desulfuromusa kysingii]